MNALVRQNGRRRFGEPPVPLVVVDKVNLWKNQKSHRGNGEQKGKDQSKIMVCPAAGNHPVLQQQTGDIQNKVAEYQIIDPPGVDNFVGNISGLVSHPEDHNLGHYNEDMGADLKGKNCRQRPYKALGHLVIRIDQF